ncbi:MAG: DUF4388 domain-containing protein [Myxococcota bacterium]|jgi:hypothetical protein|nr:DUF4388 domain-containing protein [Myxococcota bacterium]
MASALNGNLQDFGIAEVFQLIGHQRKTGMLKVDHAGREVCLAFDAGSVVWGAPSARTPDEVLGQRLIRCGFVTADALAALHGQARSSGRPFRALLVSEGVISNVDLEAIDALITHDTIFDVLRWADGSFNFMAQAIEHDRPAEKLLGAEQILMDGLRMVDEWQTFRSKVPPFDAIVERTGNVAAHRERVGREGDSQAAHFERIVQLIDGRMTLQRVIDLSRLGLFDATRAIADLAEAGLIATVERKGKARKPEAGARRVPGAARHALRAIAAAVPIALLAGLVFWIGQLGPEATEQIEAFPIERHVLDDARTMFERRRIRHALEAHRYRTGGWPETLENLDGEGWIGSDAMAGDPAAAYYYERGEGNIVLVARER